MKTKIHRIVFELSYEEQQNKCYSRAFDASGNPQHSYDMPIWGVAEGLLMEKFNNWMETQPENLNIVSIHMNIPKLELFYNYRVL